MGIARLLEVENLRDYAEQRELVWREKFRQHLCAQPDWVHRPEQDIERTLEEGLSEWWKGTMKSPLFWRWKPRALRHDLLTQEAEHMQQYLRVLTAALAPKQPVTRPRTAPCPSVLRLLAAVRSHKRSL